MYTDIETQKKRIARTLELSEELSALITEWGEILNAHDIDDTLPARAAEIQKRITDIHSIQTSNAVILATMLASHIKE